MKPNIFIGYTTESYEIANRVKNFFSPDFECTLWSEGVFGANESFLGTLLKSAGMFDFGFMILSADDETFSKNKWFKSPRDNMVFEFGLFLGNLGKDRAFLIAEKGCKMPTDMSGITYTHYETRMEAGKKIATESLERELARLKSQVTENAQLGHLGIFASTVLANSYFDNFVKHAASWIQTRRFISFGGKRYRTGELKIVIPNKLDSDMKKSAMEFYRSKGLAEGTIKHTNRAYPVKYDPKSGEDKVAIYDIPTTLSGIYRAIYLHFSARHTGKSTAQLMVENRELSNFRRVLQILINGDAHCRNCVRIE